MAKAVFRLGELSLASDTVILEPPTSYPELARFAQPEEDVQEEAIPEVYTGPTAEDLRREAEDFKFRWNSERNAMIQAARDEAETIILRARETVFSEKQRGEMDAEELKLRTREDAERIIAEAQRQAQEIEGETRRTVEAERQEVLTQGREEGRVEGYAEGKAEVDRLIERTQTVLERAQDKRGEIISETEREIIELVLLVSRKVVKVISDSQREIVVANVTEALKKVRDRGTIIIRVNLSDVKLVTDHTKEFIKLLEGVKTIQVQEDSSVDSGGCIIETDFGEIDARISSQLAEIEAKILEISPIKTRMKPKK